MFQNYITLQLNDISWPKIMEKVTLILQDEVSKDTPL